METAGTADLTGLVEIDSKAELRELIGEPSSHAAHKTRYRLHDLDRQWLARSPFCVIATADAQGRCDVSPKGDPAGFTHVLDDTTLVIPDRPGNKRMDGWMNVLDNPHVGLNYLLPGRGDTLRINGRARLLRDAPFFDALTVKGHRPGWRSWWRSRSSSTTAPRRSSARTCGSRRPGTPTRCPPGPASSRAWKPRTTPWRNWSSTTAPSTRNGSTAEAGGAGAGRTGPVQRAGLRRPFGLRPVP